MDQLAERLKNMTPLQRAVFALKETQARLAALEQQRAEPIAIVGMACRFPGGVYDPASYWRLLCDGVDAIRETPPDRWDVDAFYDPDPTAPGKMNTRWGGFLDRIADFDNHFFGISDREALRIDPQQRLLLELAWEALEDAGLPPSALRGSRTGVFLGISTSEYGIMLSSDLAQTDAHAAAGTSLCLAANRLSFTFGLLGPSLALDTACSSTLVAVHLACQNIRNGECETALAGGSNLILSPIGTINLTKAGFCASDGRVRAFDAAATGYVRSEGAGLVLLKPLSAALKNRDPIYAVIRGSALNQNGTSNGLTAPSRAAQEQVLREAYARARVSPGRVQYVETQGTGTHLGDTIEALALGSVLREGRPADSRCSIGSVKTNIGHLETASGAASLMKAALALKHRQIPPSLHFETPNPDIPFDTLPLRVQQKLEPWPDAAEPRIAGVSAFGFGGSNAHMVLEELPETDPSRADAAGNCETAGQRCLCLLPLSARTDSALRELALRYGEYLRNDPPAWRDVCHTAAARRDHHDCRLAVLADSHLPAAELLAAFPGDQPRPGVFHGRKPYGRSLKVAFVYDGQPEKWKSVLPQLVHCVPGFAAAAADVDATLTRVAGWPLATLGPDDPRWQDPAFARPTLLAVQLALAAWWRSVGLAPDVVLGQGVGEWAAACAAGILTLDEALRVAVAGGRGDDDAFVAGLQSRPAALPFLSAMDGQSHPGPDLDAAHWRRCLGNAPGLAAAVEALHNRHVDICLEIGPRSLTESIARLLPPHDAAVVAIPSLLSAEGDHGDILTAVGALYAAGADFAWGRLVPAGGRCVHVPSYPWQRQRLWAPTKKWGQAAAAANAQSSPAEAAHAPAAQSLPETRAAARSPAGAEIHVRPELTTPYVAPRTEMERVLARSWCEILHVDRVGIHDNFFELGGDSLQAAILLNQASAALGRPVTLSLRDMFEARTVATLASRVEAALQDDDAAAQLSIPRISRAGALPLSLNQEALWFLSRLEPDRPTYMLYLALNVKGPFSIPILEQALNEISRRHEILRTRFPEIDGHPAQVIEPAATRKLPVVDVSQVPESDREAELRRKLAQEMGRPIDFQNGPLVRIVLLRRAENDFVVAASMHHMIHDGWSVSVVLGELAVLYAALAAGRPSPLPELPIQYVDFAAWQRQLLQGETLQRLQAFWRKQLADVPPLELPTDFPPPPVRTTRGSSRPCRLSPQTGAAVVEFCRREGVTPFMVMLAAFEVLLARYCGQDDFAVGTPVANRSRSELEVLIGYFVNVVVLRANLGGDPSFRETVSRVRQVALDAFEHQEMTLDQVVDAVRPERHLSRNPIFQVMFALHNIQLPPVPDVGVEITPLEDCPAPPSANFALTLELFQTEKEFQGSLNFSTDLFDPETIDRMVQQYQVLVAAAVGEPERSISSLPLLAEEERQKTVIQWNDTARAYDRARLVHHLFEAQAEQRPDATAVVLGDRRWSYGELNQRANQLARHLRRQGVGPEVRVGICLERSPELVMAVLGVMKAGGAYVPLDPAYSKDAAERLKFVLADSQVSLLLTDSALSASIAAGPAQRLVLDGPVAESIRCENRGNVDSGTAAENLAYVLYTSGSTGRPKGVMVTQGNLLNAYYGWEQAYRLGSEVSAHLQMASFGFDVFGGDLVRALCSGGKLVLCRKEILLDPAELLALVRREKIDCAEFVPLVLRNLVEYLEETDQSLDFMRLVIAGSDAWYVADHRRTALVLGPRTRLINSYGLTETTIDSCYFEGDVRLLPDAALVPIGRPFANVRLYVLDDRMQPAPIGVPGQLYIGGDGVSRGYVNADLNAQRFPKDPFAASGEARLCRTGDRARWRADGQIEFLGRADNQVKIRGFRVEPGEVEELLREHAAVANAVVVARQRTAGDVRLVAYVVGRAEGSPDFAELRQFLANRLPDYMLPSQFVRVDAIPTTSSGKIDRKALPEPDWGQAASKSQFVPTRTPIEQQLAAIWSEVLNLERVGVHDNFFDLGGNSLLSLRLVARIRKDFGVELSLIHFFTSPTIAGLSLLIGDLRRGLDLQSQASFAEVDWDAELALDPVIRVTSDLQPPEKEPSRILLTGATDFLGAFLLRELLKRTGAEIYCLVRARTPEEAKKKILRNFEQYELRGARTSERIVPICGDLAQPRFGLAAEEYQKLAATVDVIYHNGAYVNFVDPYPALKPINVTGTVEVLRLATRTKVKPLHFVSTISVFDSPEYGPLGKICENQPLEILAGLQGGYAQSKCVAERIVRTAAARGLPVAIYRPGRVAADSQTGAESLTDYTTLLFKLCIELGMAPLSDDAVEMTPVDYVARSIVALAQSPQSLGNTFHLVNPQQVPLRDIYQAIRGCGYDLREVPLDVLRSRAIEVGERSQDETYAAFVHWLMVMAPAGTGRETASAAAPLGDELPQPPPQATIDCAQTVRSLEQLGVQCPVVDVEVLEKLLAFLNRKRALATPMRSTGEPAGQSGPRPLELQSMASIATNSPRPSAQQPQSLVPLRSGGSSQPLFLIHGMGGHVAAFMPLARGLAADRAVYGLQAQGLDPGQEPHDRIEAMAAFYLNEIRGVQPHGPYLLGGWSMGGLIAMEAANQLGKSGEEVSLLALLDTYLSIVDFQKLDLDDQPVIRWIAPHLKLSTAELKKLPLEQQWEMIEQQAVRVEGIGLVEIRRLAAVCRAHLAALSRHVPQPYLGPAVLLAAENGRSQRNGQWKSLCPRLRFERISGNHYTMLSRPNVDVLAERLGHYLQETVAGNRGGEMTRYA